MIQHTPRMQNGSKSFLLKANFSLQITSNIYDGIIHERMNFSFKMKLVLSKTSLSLDNDKMNLHESYFPYGFRTHKSSEQFFLSFNHFMDIKD